MTIYAEIKFGFTSIRQITVVIITLYNDSIKKENNTFIISEFVSNVAILFVLTQKIAY